MPLTVVTVPLVPHKHSYTYEEIIACASGKWADEHGVFPSLPLPPMLMLSSIECISGAGGAHGKGFAEASFVVRPSHWAFACHFRNDPVLPGCLELDGMWQLMGFFAGWRGGRGKGRALGGTIELISEILPSARTISYRVDAERIIPNKRRFIVTGSGEVLCDGERVAKGSNLRVVILNN